MERTDSMDAIDRAILKGWACTENEKLRGLIQTENPLAMPKMCNYQRSIPFTL